jgi:hypothetical protein
MAEAPPEIRPDLTVLEVVFHYRRTEQVFRKYDAAAGVCLLCQGLFDTLAEAAMQYGLPLKELLAELKAAAD